MECFKYQKIEELTKKGLMHAAGLEAFKPVVLSPHFEKTFKTNKKAWTFFQSQGSYYRKRGTNWIMSAKQEATRMSRLQKLINVSETGKQYWGSIIFSLLLYIHCN
jgi:hypothetical protein